jgi:hypothetical protein
LEDADDDVERNAMTDSNPGLRELKGLNIVLSDLRSQWEDPNSPDHYPINVTDKDNQALGPCWDAIRETFTMAMWPIPAPKIIPGRCAPVTSLSCIIRWRINPEDPSGAARPILDYVSQPDWRNTR